MKFLLQLGPINFIFSNLLLQFTLDFIDAIRAEFRFLVVQLRALIFFMWEIIFYVKKLLLSKS
jgi:hypothetical protein